MRLFGSQIRLQEWLVGFFGCFVRQAIDHPVRVLVMAATVTLAAAPGHRPAEAAHGWPRAGFAHGARGCL